MITDCIGTSKDVRADGSRTWTKHEIDMSRLAVPRPVAGRSRPRRRARADHRQAVPRAQRRRSRRSSIRIGLYYYKIDGGAFEKHVIDYGPAGEASGAGIYFWVQDLNGNGYPDIVARARTGYIYSKISAPEGGNGHEQVKNRFRRRRRMGQMAHLSNYAVLSDQCEVVALAEPRPQAGARWSRPGTAFRKYTAIIWSCSSRRRSTRSSRRSSIAITRRSFRIFCARAFRSSRRSRSA